MCGAGCASGEVQDPNDECCPAEQLDCLGYCDGSAQTDVCGVCEGDSTSCLDCLGVPFGDRILDACGVCLHPNDPAVDQACADCAGVPNGDAEPDACGVCNGDGTSCEESDNNLIIALSVGASAVLVCGLLLIVVLGPGQDRNGYQLIGQPVSDVEQSVGVTFIDSRSKVFNRHNVRHNDDHISHVTWLGGSETN